MGVELEFLVEVYERRMLGNFSIRHTPCMQHWNPTRAHSGVHPEESHMMPQEVFPANGHQTL